MKRLALVCLLAGVPGACIAPAPPVQVAPAAVGVPAAGPGPVAARRIAYDGAGNFILPDGSVVRREPDGGFLLPNGIRLTPDGAGITLPNGVRCLTDGAGGYICP